VQEMHEGYIEKVSLQDLYETALVRTGQYIASEEIQGVEFPFSTFKVLFKNQIYPLYSKYIYKSKSLNIYVTYAQPWIFPDPAPDIVSSVVPISVYGLYIGEFLNFRFLTHTSYLSTKPLSRFAIAWQYRKPVLYVGYQGQVEVRAHWKLMYDSASDEVEIDPETKDILLDLIAGYVLTSVGRARRMVRVSDSNLEFDAEAMVSEGEELIKEARERLIQLADLTALNF